MDTVRQESGTAPVTFRREGQHDLRHDADRAGMNAITTHFYVARDFSKYPGGRFKDDGPHSAEHLRDDHIVPTLARGNRIVLYLDGTMGYGGSFLEEAFGGLVRRGYDAPTLRSVLTIETTYPDVARRIWRYIDEAEGRAADAALLAAEARGG